MTIEKCLCTCLTRPRGLQQILDFGDGDFPTIMEIKQMVYRYLGICSTRFRALCVATKERWHCEYRQNCWGQSLRARASLSFSSPTWYHATTDKLNILRALLDFNWVVNIIDIYRGKREDLLNLNFADLSNICLANLSEAKSETDTNIIIIVVRDRGAGGRGNIFRIIKS